MWWVDHVSCSLPAPPSILLSHMPLCFSMNRWTASIIWAQVFPCEIGWSTSTGLMHPLKGDNALPAPIICILIGHMLHAYHFSWSKSPVCVYLWFCFFWPGLSDQFCCTFSPFYRWWWWYFPCVNSVMSSTTTTTINCSGCFTSACSVPFWFGLEKGEIPSLETVLNNVSLASSLGVPVPPGSRCRLHPSPARENITWTLTPAPHHFHFPPAHTGSGWAFIKRTSWCGDAPREAAPCIWRGWKNPFPFLPSST